MATPCRALLLTGAFIWLSGCAVGPDYEPPVVAVPVVFGTASLTPAVASAPLTADFVRWWQALHDRQLDALIEQAVASNPDIEIMLTRVQEARSQEIVVLGAMLPTVGGNAAIANGTGVNHMIGRIPLPLISAANFRGLKSVTRLAGFDARWELDLFGKYQRALEAAHDDAEAQIELRNAMLITVIADVARNYFAIRGLQTRLEVARKHVATAQKTVDLLKARSDSGRSNESDRGRSNEADRGRSSESDRGRSSEFDRGRSNESNRGRSNESDRERSNELDLTLAKRQLASRQARLPELEAAISAAESRLALLLGTYSADIAGVIQRRTKMPTLPEHLRPGVAVDLLRRRPDIRAAERELAAATARIGVATASLFPSVALTAGFGAQGGPLEGPLLPIHNPIWAFGPGAYWPLLDFGRLDALINIEEMRTHEAFVGYKKTIIAAVEEVDQAIKQYRLDRQRQKALEEALKESRRAVELATERYKRGTTDFLNVLDAQRQEFALAEEKAQVAQVVMQSYLAFYKALGGGWELYDELPPIPAPQPAVIATVRRLTNGWR
jgi:outer membrane protein TolC